VARHGDAGSPPAACAPVSPAPVLQSRAPDANARGELSWAYRDPVLGFTASAPAIGPDGTVYAIANLRLFALAPKDGSVRFSTASLEAEPFLPTPLVDEAGRILVSSGQVALYAFTSDGKRLWRAQLTGPPHDAGPVTSPVRVPGGYALGTGARILFVDECGGLRTAYDHATRLAGELAADGDGSVYAAEPGGNAVVAVSVTGLRWRSVIGQVARGFAITADSVYATTGAAGLVARLERGSGHVTAQTTLPARVGGAIVLADGTVVVAATPAEAPQTTRLYARDAALAARWQVDVPGHITLLPVATSAGIFLGTSDGTESRVFLVGPKGQVVFATDCPGCAFAGAAPAIGNDGTAFIPAYPRMIALRTPGAEDATAPWPRARGGNAQNRGAPRR
jgi:outer membrane protein assembly factor BamB